MLAKWTRFEEVREPSDEELTQKLTVLKRVASLRLERRAGRPALSSVRKW